MGLVAMTLSDPLLARILADYAYLTSPGEVAMQPHSFDLLCETLEMLLKETGLALDRDTMLLQELH
jgi:hypothetical protein